MPFVNLSSLQSSNTPPGPIGYTGSQGIPGTAAAVGYTGSAGYTGSSGSAETMLHPFMFIQGI